jgi:hypothetical protein
VNPGFKTDVMRNLLLTFILMIHLTKLPAQAIQENDNLISAGYGFPNILLSAFDAYDDNESYTNSGFGPVYFKYENIITKVVGIGINFAYASNHAEYTEYYSFGNATGDEYYVHEIDRVTYSVLGRINFHFVNKEKLDVFAGSGLGFRSAKWTFSSNDPYFYDYYIPNLVPFGFELTMGSRLMFSEHIGGYIELGFAKSPFQIGITGKF